MSPSTDRIEKRVLIPSPRERVWRAIRNAEEFGIWFGMKSDNEFEAHTPVSAAMVPTQVDEEVARKQKAFEGLRFELLVDRIEPMRLFSFRWNPDSGEPTTTLVTFELEDADGGTLLTVAETGFDALPPDRRAEAYASNEGGWEIQTRLISQYLAREAR